MNEADLNARICWKGVCHEMGSDSRFHLWRLAHFLDFDNDGQPNTSDPDDDNDGKKDNAGKSTPEINKWSNLYLQSIDPDDDNDKMADSAGTFY